jgi:ABC-2 type transport system permease protein
MILVMVRVMALGLWRDRAGLVLVFVLPPLVFIVFASVFSAGASGRLDIRAGVVDQTDSVDSHRLIASLQRGLGGRLTRSNRGGWTLGWCCAAIWPTRRRR